MTQPNITAASNALEALERVFIDGIAERNKIIKIFGEGRFPNKLDALNNLSSQVKSKARAAAATVDKEMELLLSKAEEAVQVAKQKEASSPEYSRYLQELAAIAPLVPLMTSQQALQRIENALESGLLPQARAYAEAFSIRFPLYSQEASGAEIRAHNQLRQLILQAFLKTVPGAVVEAEENLKLVNKAVETWRWQRFRLEQRIQDVFEMSVDATHDMRQGCYLPAGVFTRPKGYAPNNLLDGFGNSAGL
jgi:hypothetical protein